MSELILFDMKYQKFYDLRTEYIVHGLGIPPLPPSALRLAMSFLGYLILKFYQKICLHIDIMLQVSENCNQSCQLVHISYMPLAYKIWLLKHITLISLRHINIKMKLYKGTLN